MRLRIRVDHKRHKAVESALRKSVHFAEHTHMYVNEDSEDPEQTEIICLVDPGEFRKVEETVQKASQGAGSVEVLSCKEVEEEEKEEK